MSEFTVGDLKRQLAALDDDMKLSFDGDLTFYRFKQIADDEVFLEFAEPKAYLSDSFKKRNGNVKVAFIETGDLQGGDEAGIIRGTVDVEVR
ncbi:hypothetical protein [Paraburkholderia azotifigens]|uniref:Uncharacterized protein n=1 Tax=Paraburkholderia azotifigens TaxID=2057004 RepID=A0ABU9R4A5_9BURK